ncbi:MAG TPA: glycoside hydrolase family 9 protein [Fibrobacteria bacterium]|nr:glycoside hydrolase family 9 protein [Fibrobacteria bacterium]
MAHPHSIRFLLAIGLAAELAGAAGKLTAPDYQKALWITTRFYGGQRAGVGPNWLLMDQPNKVSYIKDSADGRDLTGGWFDCGDFPLFGQSFFNSAYTLAKAYDAFPTGFPDQYHGFDYSDYAAAKDYTYAASQPDGIPDLLQELKYATDWIIKATPDANTFYFQKGQGDAGSYGQHAHWVTSSYYSVTYPQINGGEKDKGRPIFKLGKSNGIGDNVVNDGSMPSFAAATLAIMSRIYRKFDAKYADTCLAHAKIAFEFAKKQSTTGGTAFGGFYSANNHMNDDIVTAATELFRSTNDGAYRTFAEGKKDGPKNHYYTYCYANNDDVAFYNLGKYLGMTDKWGSLKSYFIDSYTSKATGEGGLSTIGDSWGFLRYPANQAFIVGLYAASEKSDAYDQFIYNQVDFILGANIAKQSFVVGFCAGCSKSPQWPHHRNVYLDDSDKMTAVKGIPARNAEFGYLVGYTKDASGNFKESMTDYQQTEGGIDYNAGLVAALGYINSKLNPVDTSKFVGIVPASRSNAGPLLAAQREGSQMVFLASGQEMTYFEIRDAEGKILLSQRPGARSVRWTPEGRKGIAFASAVVAGQRVTSRIALP